MGERLYYYLANLDQAGSSHNIAEADVAFDQDGNEVDANKRVRVDDPQKANLISSLCDDGLHRPVLDVDEMPVWKAVGEIIDSWRTVFCDGRLAPNLIEVVPSSTPGHVHVYIEHSIRWHKYRELLIELAHRGVIQPGFANASVAREATFVRPPGVKKPKKQAA